jgi:hypothetical protein
MCGCITCKLNNFLSFLLNHNLQVLFCFSFTGIDVVKKLESYGSQSGKTSKKIIIADCGQLS